MWIRALRKKLHEVHSLGETTVNSTLSISDAPARTRPCVTLSQLVNKPFPPYREVLSGHGVARLTRRPKLGISGLVLLRRFPKKRRYRGLRYRLEAKEITSRAI